MTLIPEPSTGRLLGTQGNDNDVLTVNQLSSFPRGVWMLLGDDTLRGSSSSELIVANRGNDSILGSDGNDSILGSKEDDVLFGDGGDDILRGDNDFDDLFGGPGNDVLRGGKGDDNLFGDSGNDILIGDVGRDSLEGGSGEDTLVIRVEHASDNLSELDRIFFTIDEDFIGLTGGAVFEDLTFEDIGDLGGRADQRDILIRDFDGKGLAIVFDISPDDLQPFDFVQISDEALANVGNITV